MEERSKKILAGVSLLVILAVIAGLLYWFYQRSLKGPVEEAEVEKPSSPEKAAEGKEEGPSTALPTALPLPPLNQSDEFARTLLRGISRHGKLAEWLKIDNIIRVITATADNIASGQSPRPHLGFLSPGKAFGVREKDKKLYIDPESYQRYDLVADVVASLDTQKIVRVYQSLKPLFQEAYKELGYPERDFQDTLIQAVQRLLKTPVVEREILVKEAEKGINYLFVEDDLEDLSAAQKHLIRMGPKNSLKVQKKLRESILALGVSEDQLPSPQIYIPREK